MKTRTILILFLLTLALTTGCTSLYEVKEQPTGDAANPTQETVVVTPTIEAATQVLHSVPVPYADVAGYALSGLLSVGALWLNRKRKTAENRASTAETVNKSFVQGIESFRDILDLTEEGRALDEKLKRSLKDKQATLEVTREIADLLVRYSQPRAQ